MMIDKPPKKRKIAHLLALQCEGCSAAPMCLFCQSFLVKCMCSELNQSLNKAKLLALQQYALPNICICVVPHASLFAMIFWCSGEELNSLDAGKEMEGDTQPWRGAAAAQGRFSPPLLSRFEILGWLGLPHVLTCFLFACFLLLLLMAVQIS